MIGTLKIENFKSVRKLELPCKRINVFIGEPNTGKSNILESIGLLSFLGHGGSLRDFVRMRNADDLFYQHDVSHPIKVQADNLLIRLDYMGIRKMYSPLDITTYRNGEVLDFLYPDEYFSVDVEKYYKSRHHFSRFKFYRFRSREIFPSTRTDYLVPPDGENLLFVLRTHKKLRDLVENLLAEFGLKLAFRFKEERIEIIQEIKKHVVVALPYEVISETLQRTIFHLAAVLTNEDSVIAFEEPEAHAFPYYTRSTSPNA